MQKTAQKRSILHRLQEGTPILNGRAAEKYFKPELTEIREKLVHTDASIRSTVMGKSIEKGEVLGVEGSLKSFIKNAKTNFNRREYIGATAELGKFHFNMGKIAELCKKLELNVDKIHHDFLFKGLKDEHMDQLKDLHKRWASSQQKIIKEAGLLDVIHNITTDRGRALMAWEKRYPKVVGEFKSKTERMINLSQSVYENLLSYLQDMSAARAGKVFVGAKIDEYLVSMAKILKEFAKYDGEFKSYYNDTVKPYVDKAKLFEQQAVVESPKEMGNQEIQPSPSTTPLPTPVHVSEPSKPVTVNQPPVPEALPTNPQPDTSKQDFNHEVPETKRSEDLAPKAAYKNFLKSLEAMSAESPIILSNYIYKYALSIKGVDSASYNKLINIVAQIKE